MCGICGLITQKNMSVKKMVDSLRHRGPDDSGTYISADGKTGLGHTRLSIIDLSDAGHQPMSNENSTIWIAYNGEIYNFYELRMELKQKKHIFKSNTDTEVIVHLYEEYGEACIGKLNGMFAFSIWDENQNKLLLVRDRLGIKPLYYCYQNGEFAFGSEIKAILASGIYSCEIDRQAAYDYFSFLYVPHPQTIFKGIYQLPPSCFLTFSPQESKKKIKRYWVVKMEEGFSDRRLKKNYEYLETKIRLKDLLSDSVKRQMVSDVPMGIFLSGGIDSSILTGLMAKYSSERIKTFTVLFEGKEVSFFNEKDFADSISEAFNTDHHEVVIDISNPELLYDLVTCFDQPFGNPTFYLSYLISKYTRSHVTVALSGTGGDELFGGYPRYRAVKYYNFLNNSIIRRTFKGLEEIVDLIPDNFNRPTLRRLKLLFEGIDKDFAKQYLRWTYYFDEERKNQLFTDNFKYRDSIKFLPSQRIIEKYLNEFSRSDSRCNSVQYVDINSFLVGYNLEYTDKTSMAVGLEVRVPFLDHRIVEESFRMPFSYKLKNTTSKYILKDIFKDLIPAKNLHAQKRGFCVPLALWMRKKLDNYFDSHLSREYTKKVNIFNWEYIQFLRKQHKNGKRDNSMELFGIIMFDVWYRKYILNQ